MTVPHTWSNVNTSCGQDEFLVPSGAVNSSGWGTAPLWSKINDNSESNLITSDSTEDNSEACGTEVLDVDCEVHLSNPLLGDPGDADCNDVVFRIRARSQKAGGVGGQVDLIWAIKQGTTTIESVTSSDIGTSYSTRSHSLTNTEINNITNWDDLRFYIRAQLCTEEFEGDVTCDVAWVDFEIQSL